MTTCPQCTAKTAKGNRCRRTTCKYAPYCASHAAYRVAPSRIDGAGRGALAVRDLKKGDTIGSYTIATVKQTEAEFKKKSQVAGPRTQPRSKITITQP